MKTLVAIACLVFAAVAPAQAQVVVVFEPDGLEGFRNIEYLGGDATQAKKLMGMLILSDSTLALHRCVVSDCSSHGKKRPFRPEPLYSIPLKQIKEIVSSTLSRGPTGGEKFLLGNLAGSGTDEFVALTYESASSAEAPTFKTLKAQAAAIEAKVKFRMKKLGITLP